MASHERSGAREGALEGFSGEDNLWRPPQPSPCYAAAATTVRQVRLLLNSMRKSPGVAASVHETIQSNASRQRRAAHAMWTSLEQLCEFAHPVSGAPTEDGRGQPLPPPAFFFTPMATAPATAFWLMRGSEEEGDTAEEGYGVGRRGRPSDREDLAPRPQWNASTLPAAVSARENGPRPAERRRRSPALRPCASSSSSSSTPAGSVDCPPTRPPRHADTTGSVSFATDVTNRDIPHRERGSQSKVSGDPPRIGTASTGGAVPEENPTARPQQRQQAHVDVERQRAVRDYLRRMNILGRDLRESADAGKEDHPAFGDALFNGAALCQLVHCVLERTAPSRGAPRRTSAGQDPIPRRCPRSLEEVRVNYTAALSALSDFGEGTLPAHFFRVTPEEYYLQSRPTALLDIYFHLISHHFPPPASLAALPADITASYAWQPPADEVAFQADLATPSGSAAFRAAELRACQLLFTQCVLPDPDAHSLPHDDYIVPGPLAAPYVSATGAQDAGVVVPRLRAPTSLYVPSVFPYLTNGAALCSLARRISCTPVLTPFPLPKTRGNCLRNIAAALRTIKEATDASLPVSLAEDIFSGSRRSLVALLDVVSAYLQPDDLPRMERATSSPVAPRAASVSRVSSSQQVARRETAVAAAVRQVPPAAVTEATFGPRTREALRVWFLGCLGPTFRYTAEDGSFSVDADTFRWTEPCLAFSDGVVLAHLLRALECRRCEDLECVRPTSKRPAKRFNVRRCLSFLQKEKGMVLPLPLLDELLLSGDLSGVLHLLSALKARYRGG